MSKNEDKLWGWIVHIGFIVLGLILWWTIDYWSPRFHPEPGATCRWSRWGTVCLRDK